MRKGWFSRCQLSTVSNLADIIVGCTGLQGEVGYVTEKMVEQLVSSGFKSVQFTSQEILLNQTLRQSPAVFLDG